MHRESNWRNYLILAVTVLCLIFIFPTVRYVVYVFTTPAPLETDYTVEGKLDAESYATAVKKYDDKKSALQRKSINLGLDLIGGVDALIRVDVDKMRVRKLNSLREQLNSSLREKRIGARITVSAARDALTVTVDDKADARQAANALRDWFDSDRGWFEALDENEFAETGSGVLRLRNSVFRNEVQDSIQTAEKIIRDRVDEFGVTQPSVSIQGAGSDDLSGIRVQVPGEKDPEYVIKQIIRPAQLEFFVLHDDNDTLVPDLFEQREVEDNYGKKVKRWVLREGKSVPIGHAAMEGEITIADKNGIRRTESVMYIVRTPAAMTGRNLSNAYVQQNSASLTNPIVVGLTFNRVGAQEFKEVTTKNLQKRLAIALDGKIYSAPVIRVVIPNGQAVIEGDFDQMEARDLTLVLKAGALPADLFPDQSRVIGPTLGQESIVLSVRALVIGAVIISVFMIVYYSAAGVIAILALILNVLVIMACLNLFNATLTLSGIGGILLTIGMAVDANILIYERIREEIGNGRAVGAAIRGGFGQAFSVIFDSNLTTLLAAFVLLQFGAGSVQGFALTMAFGLIANLFTGLTVTYALCQLWFRWHKSFGLGKIYIFKNTHFDFINARKVTFVVSALLIVGGVGYITVLGGPQMAVDFQGGVLGEVRFPNSTGNETAGIVQALPGGQAKVQKITGRDNDYLVRLAIQPAPEGSAASNDLEYTKQEMEGLLKAKYGAENVLILGTTTVSQEVGQEFRSIALVVILSASFCILLYLWFRFELVFGVAAVIALIHDLLITLSIITLFKVQVSLDVVSALLILLGYSVNDTIVIFDRIRENSNTMFGKPFKEICNSAMNRTLSRTIITSGTTIGVMVIMYFFGGHSLQPFALTLIVGGLVGTYSSDFLAAPMVYLWNERQKGQLAQQLERKGRAAQVDMGVPALETAGAATPTTSPNATNRPRQGRR
jgi:SecD/SecF fusion protein